MRQKSVRAKEPAEQVVKNIRRARRRAEQATKKNAGEGVGPLMRSRPPLAHARLGFCVKPLDDRIDLPREIRIAAQR